MILRIRDIQAFACDVAIDKEELVFARLIASGEEARAIAYFAAQKGSYVDAQPHVGWVHIQAKSTQVQIESVAIQGIALRIITLYLPLLPDRFYFITRQKEVERQFRRLLHACTPYPIPSQLPPPERWGERLDTYDAQGLVALAFHQTDIQEMLKEASRAH